MTMSEFDYSEKGRPALILQGAYDALVHRGWERCGNPKRDGQRGIVAFRHGHGTKDEHIGVEFIDEIIGFPPDFVSTQ